MAASSGLASQTVRTRYAPSPTGYMHVGNLRSALYTYLIAKQAGGKFILRIEDTDQERLVPGAVEVIIKTLHETGLQYDEGPDIGGPVGPYVQSERRALYGQYAEQLIERGGAYRCFCTKQRLDELRQECTERKLTFQYDRKCRDLPASEIARLMQERTPFVVRQAVPREGVTVVKDVIYDEISFDNATLEDGILLKSDGFPTYNFANVIDDHLMGITHVVRGNEYISSSPKYDLVYRALGWEIPHYIHLPMIMKDATRKLSKRDGDASYEDFRARGFLTEAIVNYIALLGWSPGDDTELFTLDELKQRFSIKGLSKSPAIFDPKKMRWMNSLYIRKLSLADFAAACAPFWGEALQNSGLNTEKIAKMIHTRVEVLSEIPDALGFLTALPSYDISIFIHAKMKCDAPGSLAALTAMKAAFAALPAWEFEQLEQAAHAVVAASGKKNSQVLFPLRAALSGLASSWGGGVELADILGREQTMARLDLALEKLEQAVRG